MGGRNAGVTRAGPRVYPDVADSDGAPRRDGEYVGVMRPSDIVYETPAHFIARTPDGKWYETYNIGATHAVRCASTSATLLNALDKAKADVARREGVK
jgi:hypothetical protein